MQDLMRLHAAPSARFPHRNKAQLRCIDHERHELEIACQVAGERPYEPGCGQGVCRAGDAHQVQADFAHLPLDRRCKAAKTEWSQSHAYFVGRWTKAAARSRRAGFAHLAFIRYTGVGHEKGRSRMTIQNITLPA